MAFTSEAINTPNPALPIIPSDAQLPSKTFTGYDPNGTTTVTGSPNEHAGQPNVKQPNNSEERQAQASPSSEESITLSPKVSAIARREQAQRQREAQFRQREQAFQEKIAKAEKFEAIQAKLAAKDYSAAEDLGLTYEEYTNHLVTKQAEKDPAAERVRKVETELEQLKREQTDREVRDYQVNQSLWKKEITKLVSDSDDFSGIKSKVEKISTSKLEDIILEHVNSSFEEDNIELSAEQATKEITDAIGIKLEEIRQAFEISPRSSAPERRLGAPKTITQNMTVSSQKPVKKPFHLMSDSEQIAEAYRRVQEAKLQR